MQENFITFSGQIYGFGFSAFMAWFCHSSVLFHVKFPRRKHRRPLLQWENTGCITIELFQKALRVIQDHRLPMEPFETCLLSQELVNVSRNDVLISPPCSWHLAWQQRGAGRIPAPWGSRSCAHHSDMEEGCQELPRGPPRLVPCWTALCHLPAAPLSNHFPYGCHVSGRRFEGLSPLRAALYWCRDPPGICSLPETQLITIYLQGSPHQLLPSIRLQTLPPAKALERSH